jgi:hypothetical protein
MFNFDEQFTGLKTITIQVSEINGQLQIQLVVL